MYQHQTSTSDNRNNNITKQGYCILPLRYHLICSLMSTDMLLFVVARLRIQNVASAYLGQKHQT